MVFGAQGVAGAESSYYIPSSSAWDEISDFSATENYQAGDIVLSGGQFLQANSNLSAGVLNLADWSDVTSAINDLSDVGSGNLVDDFWTKADLSTSNSTYWQEIAHANGRDDFDSEYWQEVAPDMKRFDSTELEPYFQQLITLYGHMLVQWDPMLAMEFQEIVILLKMACQTIRILITIHGVEVQTQVTMWFIMVKVYQAASSTILEPGVAGSEGDYI